MTDEQLVKKCLEKDSAAQEYLFNLYSRKMMGVCLRYSRDEDEAKDVLQVGFIKVFEKLDLYNQEGSLEGWIRKVVINTALDNIRKNKKENDNIEIDKVDYQLSNEGLNGYEAMKTKDLLNVIQAMPVGFRTVFNLYAIEGYSHKEIADQLGISVNTSKSQYSRARVYLQNVLSKKEVF
ncbi:MAG: RNA polymerase sigma factor [Vicingus serpentipes]|nr:RNA polymerase sigma factor [Vicingus serpentipes]